MCLMFLVKGAWQQKGGAGCPHLTVSVTAGTLNSTHQPALCSAAFRVISSIEGKQKYVKAACPSWSFLEEALLRSSFPNITYELR